MEFFVDINPNLRVLALIPKTGVCDREGVRTSVRNYAPAHIVIRLVSRQLLRGKLPPVGVRIGVRGRVLSSSNLFRGLVLGYEDNFL